MRYYLFAIVAAFFLGVSDIIFWPLIPIAIAIVKDVEQKKVYALSFVSGILVDLLWGQPLGMTALLLLIYSGAIFFLVQKFKSQLRIILGITLVVEVVSFILIRVGIMHF